MGVPCPPARGCRCGSRSSRRAVGGRCGSGASRASNARAATAAAAARHPHRLADRSTVTASASGRRRRRRQRRRRRRQRRQAAVPETPHRRRCREGRLRRAARGQRAGRADAAIGPGSGARGRVVQTHLKLHQRGGRRRGVLPRPSAVLPGLRLARPRRRATPEQHLHEAARQRGRSLLPGHPGVVTSASCGHTGRRRRSGRPSASGRSAGTYRAAGGSAASSAMVGGSRNHTQAAYADRFSVLITWTVTGPPRPPS